MATRGGGGDEKRTEDGEHAKLAASSNTLKQDKENLNQGRGGSGSNQNQHESPNIISDHERQCYECNRSLAKSKQLINISGQAQQWWHPECFRCSLCNQSMDGDSSCHIYKDKLVCRRDYARLQRDHMPKCSRCQTPIGASDWVRKAAHYVYHLACFSCDICLRQLSTGEQFTLKIQDKNTVRLLCRLHFAIENHRSPGRGAGGGGGADHGASPLGIDLDLKGSLDAANLGSHFGEPQFGGGSFESSAAAAAATTRSLDLNRCGPSQPADRYLHLLASTSGQSLSGGGGADQRYLSDLELRQSSDSAGRLAGLKFDPSADLSAAAAAAAASTTTGDHQHQHQHHHHQQHQQQHRAVHTSNTTSSIASSGSSNNGCHSLASLASKSKRVRTTFTEDQLSILQTHFHIDSNPDGADLDRIATITGLTKRVTQVWFQNSRARQKKYMTKRKPQAASSSSLVNSAISTATPTTSSAAAAAASTASGADISSQSQFINHHHGQRAESIGGECFSRMRDGHEQKWLNMAGGADTMSSGLSLDESRDLGVDEEDDDDIDEDDDDDADNNDDDADDDDDDDESRSSENDQLVIREEEDSDE